MLNYIRDGVKNFLSYNNVKFFNSGSTRFGYTTKKSDIDFIVYSENFKEFCDFLKSKGFISRKDYIINSGMVFLKDAIHINVIKDEDIFITLHAEHLKIDDMLKEKAYLIPFIIKLKEELPEIKGSAIYKTLLSLT